MNSAAMRQVTTGFFFCDEPNRLKEMTTQFLLEVMQQNRLTFSSLIAITKYGAANCPGIFVVAAQNGPGSRGVHRLNEALLDRFLVRVGLRTPTPEIMAEILAQQLSESLPERGKAKASDPKQELLRKATLLGGQRPSIDEIRGEVAKVVVPEDIYKQLIPSMSYHFQSRSDIESNPDFLLSRRTYPKGLGNKQLREILDGNIVRGCGTRGNSGLLNLSRAFAWTVRRAVTKEDVLMLAPYVLSHRIEFDTNRGIANNAFEQMKLVWEVAEIAAAQKGVWGKP
jgi:MoxR-like ATPase